MLKTLTDIQMSQQHHLLGCNQSQPAQSQGPGQPMQPATSNTTLQLDHSRHAMATYRVLPAIVKPGFQLGSTAYQDVQSHRGQHQQGLVLQAGTQLWHASRQIWQQWHPLETCSCKA
jgi:hypothetical protein